MTSNRLLFQEYLNEKKHISHLKIFSFIAIFIALIFIPLLNLYDYNYKHNIFDYVYGWLYDSGSEPVKITELFTGYFVSFKNGIVNFFQNFSLNLLLETLSNFFMTVFINLLVFLQLTYPIIILIVLFIIMRNMLLSVEKKTEAYNSSGLRFYNFKMKIYNIYSFIKKKINNFKTFCKQYPSVVKIALAIPIFLLIYELIVKFLFGYVIYGSVIETFTGRTDYMDNLFTNIDAICGKIFISFPIFFWILVLIFLIRQLIKSNTKDRNARRQKKFDEDVEENASVSNQISGVPSSGKTELAVAISQSLTRKYDKYMNEKIDYYDCEIMKKYNINPYILKEKIVENPFLFMRLINSWYDFYNNPLNQEKEANFKTICDEVVDYEKSFLVLFKEDYFHYILMIYYRYINENLTLSNFPIVNNKRSYENNKKSFSYILKKTDLTLFDVKDSQKLLTPFSTIIVDEYQNSLGYTNGTMSQYGDDTVATQIRIDNFISVLSHITSIHPDFERMIHIFFLSQKRNDIPTYIRTKEDWVIFLYKRKINCDWTFKFFIYYPSKIMENIFSGLYSLLNRRNKIVDDYAGLKITTDKNNYDTFLKRLIGQIKLYYINKNKAYVRDYFYVENKYDLLEEDLNGGVDKVRNGVFNTKRKFRRPLHGESVFLENESTRDYMSTCLVNSYKRDSSLSQRRQWSNITPSVEELEETDLFNQFLKNKVETKDLTEVPKVKKSKKRR